MPGSGDSIQALKAGIMEIPDVIAINKMDQPGAKAMLNDIRTVMALGPDAERQPAIVLTEAVREEGIEGLWQTLAARRDALAAAGELEERRRRNLAAEVVAVAAAAPGSGSRSRSPPTRRSRNSSSVCSNGGSIRSRPSTRSSKPSSGRPHRDAADPRRHSRSGRNDWPVSRR